MNGPIDFLRSTPQNVGSSSVLATGTTHRRLLAERFAEVFNVKDFGALGDGTTEDTDAIQAAIDAAIAAGGGRVVFPDGTYLTGRLNGGSNLTFEGRGYAVLKQISGLPQTAAIISYNGDNGGTANPDDNLRNIRFENLTLEGRSVEDGFSEHKHLVYLNAVSDVVFYRCRFLAPQGDCICVGGAVFGGSQIERHNLNIVVQDCFFDGVNWSGRNGFSGIDVQHCRISNCYFTRLSRAGMPGPIDFEPNFADDLVGNLEVVGCTFVNNKGGFAVALYLLSGGAGGNGFRHLRVEGNYVASDNVFGGAAFSAQTAMTITEATPHQSIVIKDNYVAIPSIPFLFRNLSGLTLEGNTFDGCSTGLLSDYATLATKVYNVRIAGNKFYKSGNAFGQITIGSVKYTDIIGNLFQEPINAPPAFIIFFGEGVVNASDFVRVNENNFIKGGSASVTNTVMLVNHTLSNAENNTYLSNKSDVALTNAFPFELEDYRQVNSTSYTSAKLPDSFTAPFEQTTVTNDLDLPTPFDNGILMTYVPPEASSDLAGYRAYVTQLFLPANALINGFGWPGFYMRRGRSDANAWDDWRTSTDMPGEFKNANYTLQLSDSVILFFGGTHTARLPDAADHYGKTFTIINSGGATGPITVRSFDDTQLINAAPSLVVHNPFDVAILYSAGDRWWILSHRQELTGIVTLVAGAATVLSDQVTADSRVFLTPQNGDALSSGALFVSARVPGTSFSIGSTSGTDVSTVAWKIFEP